MRFLTLFGLAVTATAAPCGNSTASGPQRYVLYYDQWRPITAADNAPTAGITHVIMSFANSSLFASQPAGEYKPFQPLDEVRALFDNGTKICLALGGWADTAGFSEGAETAESRTRFAKNVVATLDQLGYDCIDIDWEYPGGNGEDYKRTPNSDKVSEIETYPLLLAEIKKAVGTKELSIAVPALERDMIAYTATQVPIVAKAVDFVNIMTYDLMNRRDNYTTHQTSVHGTLHAVNKYIELGVPADKIVFGIPFYAKWYTTKEGYACEHPVGCPVELLENPVDGSDTGKSGSMTFQKANFEAPPANLTISPDAVCGAGTLFKCGDGNCCSTAGFCGDTAAHCGTGCQSAYGRCEGTDISGSFLTAMAQGRTDEVLGAQWYWDAANRLFWSWDTPELITKKIDILAARGVRSLMAWSIGGDSNDWSHLKAMQTGFEKVRQH